VTGDLERLFKHPTADHVVEKTAAMAVDLLACGHTEGGQHTVILSPSLVGMLAHEAVGHTVEADFVASGSVAKGKIGQRVASDLVTLCDTGIPPVGVNPVAQMAFDDEGVPCRNVTIIDKGVLSSYLHSRESAAQFGVEPTGNGRAWEYDNEPLIRMRNTYFLPGSQSLDEIIADTRDGFLLDGTLSGQADSTGEFMCGVQHALEIKNGSLTGRKFRDVTISGVAFDVLQSVDALSSDFQWDLGSGYCGKWQTARVDAGGPYMRCKITLGGRK
jgi:TldD protein